MPMNPKLKREMDDVKRRADVTWDQMTRAFDQEVRHRPREERIKAMRELREMIERAEHASLREKEWMYMLSVAREE